jgi:hypothetical protein
VTASDYRMGRERQGSPGSSTKGQFLAPRSDNFHFLAEVLADEVGAFDYAADQPAGVLYADADSTDQFRAERRPARVPDAVTIRICWRDRSNLTSSDPVLMVRIDIVVGLAEPD